MKFKLKQKNSYLLVIKYIINSLLLFIFVFIFAGSVLYFLPDDQNIHAETLEEELERVKKQRESTQNKIEQAKKDESQYMSQVKQVEGELVSALNDLDDLNEKVSNIKTEIDKLTVDLVIKQDDLAEIEKILSEKDQIFNDRVATIYKNREQDTLKLLFETNSFINFFSNLKLMSLIAKQDHQILKEVQETRKITEQIKETIEEIKKEESEHKKQMEGLVSVAEQKKREIEGIYAEKKSLLSKTRANKEALIKMEKELAEKEAEITKMLEALRHGTAPGKLLYPARGVLTSGFGYRISPLSGTKQFHGGIDIGAATGTPIRAAASGEVLSASYMGGYGYSILVYHGGGFATFYAHLSGFAVSSGQNVRQGQVIGYMGSTGYSTGPHLHFEVRVNGIRQNPYDYF